MSEQTAVEIANNEASVFYLCETLVPIINNEPLLTQVAGAVNLQSMLELCKEHKWNAENVVIAFEHSPNSIMASLEVKTVETRDVIDLATVLEAVTDNKLRIKNACVGVVFLPGDEKEEDDGEYALALFERSIN